MRVCLSLCKQKPQPTPSVQYMNHQFIPHLPTQPLSTYGPAWRPQCRLCLWHTEAAVTLLPFMLLGLSVSPLQCLLPNGQSPLGPPGFYLIPTPWAQLNGPPHKPKRHDLLLSLTLPASHNSEVSMTTFNILFTYSIARKQTQMDRVQALWFTNQSQHEWVNNVLIDGIPLFDGKSPDVFLSRSLQLNPLWRSHSTTLENWI